VLVSLLVLGTLVMTHQRAVGTPLSRLIESMKQVSEGDKTHRALAQGPRELKQLAIGLNGMLDAIDAAEDSEKAQRRAREKMAKRLRHSETMAALGQLSAGVAHELGAPLTVVDGRANRLLRRTDDTEQSRELNTIRQQVQRMTAIVEQLLSFGRSARHHRQRIDVRNLTQRARKQLDDEGRRITLVPGPEVSLYGDPLSLEQALVNLMRNACQAHTDGNVQLSWHISGEDLFIQVDDDGPGIADHLRDSVFDPFVTTKQPGEGSGLGLAIVRRIVRDHDGDIMLDDSPLGGARFQLRIPMKQDTYPA